MYRRNSTRGFLGGISGGIFLIGLAIAFFSGHFLPVLFVTLAFTSLLGSASSLRPNGIYGGLYGFVWMLGLAFCFAFGFWPWILVIVGLSAILGAMRGPIMAAIVGTGIFGASQPAQSSYQPYQPPPTYQEQPGSGYQPYQQGYQAPVQPQETYQEGGQPYQYPPQSQQPQQPVQPQYEQPQTQYPQQQMPPQQQ
ncbi:MAG: hypothetical protein ABI396_03795 [Ktedonobacteraceae bacterium]